VKDVSTRIFVSHAYWHVAQTCWTELGQTVTWHEVERFIKAPGRTAPSYLLKPLRDQAERAMRAIAMPLQTIDSIEGGPDLVGRPCGSSSMDESRGRRPLEHDPEKCAAVFRKDHAQTIT